MPKQVFIVVGDKGGVGKSLFCKGLAGTLLDAQNLSFGILDGDIRNPDVAQTFAKTQIPTVTRDMRNSNQRPMLIDEIDAILQKHECVIVNGTDVNGNVMAFLDSMMFAFPVEKREVLLKVFYVMSHQLVMPHLLTDLHLKFMQLYPTRNLHFGETTNFKDFASFAPKFRTVVNMPALGRTEADFLFKNTQYPQALLGSDTTFLIPKSRYYRWQNAFDSEIVNLISPSNEQQNTRS